MLNSIKGSLNCLYVVFAFISALLLGALKGLIFGPIAALVLIIGNVGVILGLFPYHVAWTVYTLVKFVHIPACIADGADRTPCRDSTLHHNFHSEESIPLFIGWYRLLHDLISRGRPVS
ncbi:hypothetical protein IFM89_023532 [Coptis chinensis]|uniref:Uncharacterized protein n=1 Tax=Coptis chinensis TaxID=261450 RepID=A0A835LFD7_9MAGN|nr:hypothetical protein IFM89_023532 [Coptis chinensis]